jgi:hypothetical protein
MVNIVGYNTDIIPYAMATIENPSGDGKNFVWEDKDDSWTMEAVRQADGSIKGFKVGEECPYYDEWSYASLERNYEGEYAILKSWDSAVEDFTWVSEFNENGIGYAQEGRNYFNYDALAWEGYFYKPYSGYDNYGYWYTYDLEKFEYIDTDSAFCIGYFDKNASTMNITDPYRSCPHVANGWNISYVNMTEKGEPYFADGPDGEPWYFYEDEYELVDAMADVYGGTNNYYNEDGDYEDYDLYYEDPVFEIYLVPEDFAQSEYYGYLTTYDSSLSEWEYWDSDGNVCTLTAKMDATGYPEGFTVTNYDDFYVCPSSWTYSSAVTSENGDYMTGPDDSTLWVTELEDFYTEYCKVFDCGDDDSSNDDSYYSYDSYYYYDYSDYDYSNYYDYYSYYDYSDYDYYYYSAYDYSDYDYSYYNYDYYYYGYASYDYNSTYSPSSYSYYSYYSPSSYSYYSYYSPSSYSYYSYYSYYDYSSYSSYSFDYSSYSYYDYSSFDYSSFDYSSFDYSSFDYSSFDYYSFDYDSFDYDSFDYDSFDYSDYYSDFDYYSYDYDYDFDSFDYSDYY